MNTTLTNISPSDQQINDDSKIIGLTAQRMLQNYASISQAISLANKPAKIKIENSEESDKEFQKMLLRSNFGEKNALLEKFLSLNGEYCLTFTKKELIDSDGEVKPLSYLTLAKPIMYVEDGNRITYLMTQVEEVRSTGGQIYWILEEWSLDRDSINYYAVNKTELTNYFYGKSNSFPKRTKPSEIEIYNNFGEKVKYSKFDSNKANIFQKNIIPFKIFRNNFDGKADLANIPFVIFSNIDKGLKVIGSQMLNARALAWLNVPTTRDDQAKKIAKSMQDPDSSVITTNIPNSFMQGNGFNIVQASTQIVDYNTAINQALSWVKEFAFLKKQANDSGKNNKQTAEIESLNSDYEDMIEYKANSREYQFKDLVLIWKIWHNEVYKLDKNVKQMEFNLEDVKVLVTGSTKWLQEEANKYSLNQNGVAINTQAPKIEAKKPEEQDNGTND